MSKSNEKIDELNIKVLELNNKIESIFNLLIEINTKIDKITESTSNMNSHINFVEKTYESIKKPFHYLMDKVSYLTFLPFSNKTENNKPNNLNELKQLEY